MANKSFFGRLASKNKKSSYEVSKDTGISEDKIKEVFTGERELPAKHVDAVMKSIQSKDGVKDLDYLNAKAFFESNDVAELRHNFGYGTQKGLAEAIHVSNCYISRLEGRHIKMIPREALVRIYDFFQDDLNKSVTFVNGKPKGRKKSVDNSTEKKFNEVICSDFDPNSLFNALTHCEFGNVVTLYYKLKDFINRD